MIFLATLFCNSQFRAEVSIYFELSKVLTILSKYLIISGPRGHWLHCPQNLRGGSGGEADPGQGDGQKVLVDRLDRSGTECQECMNMLDAGATGDDLLGCTRPEDRVANIDNEYSKFKFYLNITTDALISEANAIGNLAMLEDVVPFSFFVKMTTPGLSLREAGGGSFDDGAVVLPHHSLIE